MRWLLGIALVVACGGKQRDPAPPPPVANPEISERLVRDLAILTTQAEPSAALKLLAARHEVDSVISMLLDDRRFTNTVVPTMLLEDYRFTSYLSVNGEFVLKKPDDPTQPLYLRKPCKASDATSVEPWWAPGTLVLVCNDSYKPDVLTTGVLPGRPTAPQALCGSFRGDQPDCGCGKNLIHCTRDADMRTAVRKSLGAEVFDTIGHVVSAGLPLQSIYVDNATVRDRNAEILYRMHDAARGKPWKSGLDKFEKPAWMPRTEDFPGQHAGILTATGIARFTDVPRSEMMAYFAMMTCASSDGAHVDGKQALGIDTADIRSESGGKDYLARAVGCTNCHARMEHAIPFFAAWRSIFHSIEIEPELQQIKEGHVYLNNIDDLRGTTKTTPSAFAQVVVAQPEFARCQAGRIVRFIFNEEIEPDLQDRLATMIAARKPAREVLKTALQVYVQRMSTGMSAPVVAGFDLSYKRPFVDDAVRTFDKPLLQVMTVCEDCHSDGDRWMDKAVKSHQASALQLLRMADMVASGSMPKKIPLANSKRAEIVTVLAQAAWGDAKIGRETADVLLGRRRPASVHEFGTVIGLFEKLAPIDTPWKVPEILMKPGNNFLTPGTATTYGLEALRTCRAREKVSGDVEKCIDGILRDGAFLRVTPRDARSTSGEHK